MAGRRDRGGSDGVELRAGDALAAMWPRIRNGGCGDEWAVTMAGHGCGGGGGGGGSGSSGGGGGVRRAGTHGRQGRREVMSSPSPLLPPPSARALAREEKLQGSSSCHYVPLTRV